MLARAPASTVQLTRYCNGLQSVWTRMQANVVPRLGVHFYPAGPFRDIC